MVPSGTVRPLQRSTELSVQLTVRRDPTGCTATSTVIVQADPGTHPEASSETDWTSPVLAGGRSASAGRGAVANGGGAAGAIPGPGGRIVAGLRAVWAPDAPGAAGAAGAVGTLPGAA